jgi:hypothetical protein
VIRRCAAFVKLTCNRLEAGGSKLEAWLTVADFLSFEPQASRLKLKSALADGLMLVFKHTVRAHFHNRNFQHP